MAKNLVPIQAKADKNVITLQFDGAITSNDLRIFASQMQEMFEMMQAKIEMDNKNTMKEIGNVKEIIKSKHISPEDLAALEALVDKKARAYVDKAKGVQLSIDVVLNYDRQGIIELQKLIRKEYGKTKHRIWIELNKQCLKRKGTDPKNRIKDTDVEKAFDFVRRWGGMTI
ncbi:hypothetical protein K7T73_12700 [Bacillus badius]|uniref:hypothetical protein n=1 Tax=Bacillus badius TaxID=1455 RepID=UPI001CBE716B|nr:hypothetical protein [Bacillus badius]UAT29459.1 hypothetical protein K7T73_12700 [Bacillus badius]